MRTAFLLLAGAAILGFSTAADAHSLRLECKKTTADNVTCRTLASDGEILRNVAIQLIDENDKSVSTGKTDVKGEYTFKAPAMEYNVVVQANKSHVASVSSEDIW